MATIDLHKLKQTNQSKTPQAKSEKAKGSLDFLNKEISFSGAQLSDKKKERFYSELTILFNAGIDIKTSLDLIEEQQQKVNEKKMFGAIRQDLINGVAFSEALKNTGKFSDYEYYTLQIGEESGKLPEVLNDLATYYSGRIALKRQIVSAISYPIIVLVVAFGAVFFMLRFVVPMFSDVFRRFGSDLPALTKMIIRVSNGLGYYSGYFLVLILTGLILVFSQKKKTWYRRVSSRIVLRIPVVGRIVQNIYLARLCNSMQLLIAARTPLVTAIDLVRKMVGFYPLENSLEVIQQEILKGTSLHESMGRFPIYNKRMLSLVKVAEEVNQLEMIFTKLAKMFSDEVEHETKVISSLLEPLMIVFLGLFVLVVLVAMYLPMFQLSSSVH